MTKKQKIIIGVGAALVLLALAAAILLQPKRCTPMSAEERARQFGPSGERGILQGYDLTEDCTFVKRTKMPMHGDPPLGGNIKKFGSTKSNKEGAE